MRLENFLNEDKVEDLTKKYDKLGLECDGMTRVLSYVLMVNNIKHTVYQGSVEYEDDDIPLHFWIELSDGRTVDYRARMWLGDHKDVPHGVFKKSKFPKVKYQGKAIKMNVDKRMFDILTL